MFLFFYLIRMSRFLFLNFVDGRFLMFYVFVDVWKFGMLGVLVVCGGVRLGVFFCVLVGVLVLELGKGCVCMGFCCSW